MSLITSRTISRARMSAALAAAACALAACDKSDSPTDPGSATKLIVVSSPTTGSTWKIGDSLKVDWTVKASADPNKLADALDVLLSPDGGANWQILNKGSISPDNAAQWGKYRWKIPDSLLFKATGAKVSLKSATHCRIRVEQYSTADADLITETGDFTIKE